MLPSRKTGKKRSDRKPLAKNRVAWTSGSRQFCVAACQSRRQSLARNSHDTAAQRLTLGLYRKHVKKLSITEGWKYQEFDVKTLRKMGAGAFVAVAQGSDPEDAAIVHLQRRVKHAAKTVALVGKGICFDTGGHNLKPARHMQGMHEDMNGSAVALGILLAATRADLPVNIDCWLAIAQNHIGPALTNRTMS